MSKSIVKRKTEIIAHQVSVEIDELLERHGAKLYIGSDKIFVSVVRAVGTDIRLQKQGAQPLEDITELSQIERVDLEI